MTVHERTRAVKAEAAALGFDAYGVAEAGPIDEEDHLGAWLDNGYAGEMTWIAATREVRRDIRRRLPGARSVVVVARNYYAPRPDPPPNAGRVARYAWGRDYHRVLRKPIRALARRIEALEPDARSYCSVDTGPVLEKAWAARAGVGWIGKNSLVLREDLGSWLFLGVIATTLELVPDAPVPDRCGACRLCIDACPTGAIVAERVLDARRCIAYHTIEARKNDAPALAESFGHWVFGCDICQDVCPWNRDAPTTSEPDFRPRPDIANPRLDHLAAIDDDAFNTTFAGTAITRASAAKLGQNAQRAR